MSQRKPEQDKNYSLNFLKEIQQEKTYCLLSTYIYMQMIGVYKCIEIYYLKLYKEHRDSPPQPKEKARCYMQQTPYYREQKHLRS